MNRTPSPVAYSLLGGVAISLTIGLAFIANAQTGFNGETGIDASGSYQQERVWCQQNTSDASLVNCLQNSAAAQAARRNGTLSNGSTAFEANALMRCQPFRGEENAACRARVTGMGVTTGSVMGGGILKSVERTVPASAGTAN